MRTRQDNYDLRAGRGLSAIHTPQRLVLTGVWDLPFGKGQAWLSGTNAVVRRIVEGWQMNWIGTLQTGNVLSVTSSVNTTQSQGGAQRPNSTGASPKLEGPVKNRLNRYFDTAQFANAAPYQFGNLGRTLADVLGPGLHNWDISLFKNISVAERLKFQIRCEAFNVWNHPAFGNPGVTFGTASFGRINEIANRANPARQIQLAGRMTW